MERMEREVRTRAFLYVTKSAFGKQFASNLNLGSELKLYLNRVARGAHFIVRTSARPGQPPAARLGGRASSAVRWTLDLDAGRWTLELRHGTLHKMLTATEDAGQDVGRWTGRGRTR